MTPRPQLLLRFADDAQRERLAALAATWGCTPQAALRRLLDEATTATTADVVTLLRAVLLAQGERPCLACVRLDQPCQDHDKNRTAPPREG